ncbi:MAG: archease [Candidatus Velamenicoccus archaeovorus]
MDPRPSAGHELVEHTADLGLRAWAPTPEQAFAEGVLALVEVLDVRADRAETTEPIRLHAPDRGGLLVDLLNEVLFLAETRDRGVAAVRVTRASDRRIEAEIDLGPLARPSRGTVVKAATYHQLAVDVAGDGTTELQVFLDV